MIFLQQKINNMAVMKSLLICLLLLQAFMQGALSQETSENGEDTTEEAAEGTTDAPEVDEDEGPHNLTVEHLESSTSHIKISWKIPKSYEDDVTSFKVTSQKTSSEAVTKSGDIEPTDNEYVIEDLKKDTEYEICIYVHKNNEDGVEVLDEKCLMIATVATISAKSLIILFCVLGYIFLMILIGWCVWRQHVKKILAEREEDEEEEQIIKPEENPQTYLAPPANNAPKSSIEDQDIPYITPPVSQLSPKEKESYNKALV